MKPKFEFIHSRLQEIKKRDLYRRLHPNKVSGENIFFGKRKLVNFSSNDYLGLGLTALPRSQLQSSSRLVSGNDVVFEKLESRLARHKYQEASLVFPTGYMANLGMISAIPQKGDMVLSDELNHASIIDSCRLGHSKKIIYHHNDMRDLERKIRKKSRRKFVVTEGIFSMNGDFSKLDQITELCKKHGAFLILDDAHGDFVAGPDGRGSGAHFGVARMVDIYISSLSKGLGAFGGYAASTKEVIDLAVNTSRSFIYTSALPNFLVQVALDKFNSERERQRTKLWKNTGLVKRGLESAGYAIDSETHIIPIVIGDEKKAMGFGRYLFDNGIFAQPIRYPTVGRGKARIRISVTAWLSSDSIARSIEVFGKAGKKFGVT
ncbi:MAG TPA: pyridoxal phosphate-dependent aminotransferase family protein [Candidatus Nitrosotalea sp.]|nr:pyridoxal phosphate-dependent aminotransferase family protein [Candidatus Nitrosotalea sp.]